MKIAAMTTKTGQALVVRIDERPNGEAYIEFTGAETGADVVYKLRELASSIEDELNG